MSANNHLLLVDDEDLNRDMLSRRLEHNGFEVDTAADGPSALAAIGQNRPDLVLLDSMMPGMSGVEVLQALRASYTPDQLPIIMVTALKDGEKVVEALTLGANDYITKPVDFPVAVARIQGQLARLAAASALRQSEERYATAARGASAGLWDWDLESGKLYYSECWKSMLGYAKQEIGDGSEEWLSRVHPEDLANLQRAIATEMGGGSGEGFECEHRVRHRDGAYRWMRCRAAAARNARGEVNRIAGSITDFTESKRHDPLTGLANRANLVERVEEEFAACRANGGSFALIFLDIDRFKLINDSLGRAAGDRLLVMMGERIQRALGGSSPSRPGPGDLIARISGNEFAILVCRPESATEPLKIAEQVLREMRDPFGLDGRGIFCSVSLGIAPYAAQHASAAEMIRDADTAMHSAKSRGRSRYEVFEESMRTQLKERLSLENDLRHALEEHDLTVNYQPKVRLADRRICGFEALARWRHPTRGWVPPCEFVAIAEEIGLIHMLDMWILREACAQMKRWEAAYPCDPPLMVSVNLSPRQFSEPNLVEQIAEVLRETRLSPASLSLEITETVLMNDQEMARRILTQLKGLGVGLKIDDFGTGYSSLAYLAQLPFDTMKIDRSFTSHLEGGDCNSDIVKSILDMAHTMKMDVVAEGVEQHEQITRLIAMGCEFGQGYFFSKPVSTEEAGRLVAATANPANGHPYGLCSAVFDRPARV